MIIAAISSAEYGDQDDGDRDENRHDQQKAEDDFDGVNDVFQDGHGRSAKPRDARLCPYRGRAANTRPTAVRPPV